MFKRQRVLHTYRWVIVAGAFSGVLVLAQACVAAAHQQPTLGLRAARRGAQLNVTWVQPAGFAWDAKIRPGDVVTEIAGQRVGKYTRPEAVASASTIQIRSHMRAQRLVTVSLSAASASAQLTSANRRVTFFTLAACFMVVGAAIYLLSIERATGQVVLGLSVAAATALIVAVITPFRADWALNMEHVAVTVFCASVFLLFLVFPTNRLSVIGGRLAAGFCLVTTLTLLGLYTWVISTTPAAFSWLEPVGFIVMATHFIGAAGLAIYALAQRSTKQREVRPALTLIVIGILAGLAPFCLLAIFPRLFGHSSVLVAPEHAILSIVLLPVGLGAAVLSRQFPGVRRVVRRSLIALAVWTMLVTTYTIGLYVLYQTLDTRQQPFETTLPLTALVVAFIGATFTPGQSWLRRAIERVLFHGVYNYAETLERLSNEIARLGSIETIAWHVLRNLAQMLDLSWAAITLRGSGTPGVAYRWGDCPERLARSLDGSISSIHTDETQAQINETEDWNALLVPLVADETSLGILAIGPKRREIEYLPEDKVLIATLAPLVTTALHNALLTQSLEQQVATLAEREYALAALTERLLQAHEEERRRIALDLHDDPLQRAILLTREMSEVAGGVLPSNLRRSAEEIAISLRAICTGLRPPLLDDLGLVAALEWLASDVSARSDLAARFDVAGFEPTGYARIEADLEVALYRVAQEALANCMKHARASHVWVTLLRDASRIQLCIVDDGLGPSSVEDDANGGLHLGLLGMRERLRPWGGTVSIDAGPTGGTKVAANIGLREDNE